MKEGPSLLLLAFLDRMTCHQCCFPGLWWALTFINVFLGRNQVFQERLNLLTDKSWPFSQQRPCRGYNWPSAHNPERQVRLMRPFFAASASEPMNESISGWPTFTWLYYATMIQCQGPPPSAKALRSLGASIAVFTNHHHLSYQNGFANKAHQINKKQCRDTVGATSPHHLVWGEHDPCGEWCCGTFPPPQQTLASLPCANNLNTNIFQQHLLCE